MFIKEWVLYNTMETKEIKSKETENIRITTSFKIDRTIKDKFKVYCIENNIDMSELLEKLIEKEIRKQWKEKSYQIILVVQYL